MNAILNSLELGVDLVRCFVIVLIGHLVELGTLRKRERENENMCHLFAF